MTDMTGFDWEMGMMPGPDIMNDRFMRLELRTRELEDALEALHNDLSHITRQLNDPSIMRERGRYDTLSNDCMNHLGMSRAIPEMDDPTDLKTFEERARLKSLVHDSSHPAAVRAQGIADAVDSGLRTLLDSLRASFGRNELWANGRAYRHQSVADSGEDEFVRVEIDVGNMVLNKKDNTFEYESDTRVDGRDDEAVAVDILRKATDALCTRFGVTYDERAERNRRLAGKRMSDRWWKAEEERMRMEDAG